MRKVLAWVVGVIVVLILIGIVGGGSDDGSKKATTTAAATTSAKTQTAPATDARDAARAAAVRKAYGADALDRWQIRKVAVDGGDVRVTTALFPKTSNDSAFTGACVAMMDYFGWMESIAVEGSDGNAHATWSSGDQTCQTQGL